MGRVVFAYAIVLAAVCWGDSRLTEALRQPIEAVGIMLALPVFSLWADEWLSDVQNPTLKRLQRRCVGAACAVVLGYYVRQNLSVCVSGQEQ